jgi:hypothetical protein
VGTSGVLHWITYAEALVTLEDLGWGEVARRGHRAQQQQINRPVADRTTREPERAPVDWRGPDYWESDAPRRPLNGSWLFGHSFKLPYSLFRLLRRVDDPVLREAALVRAGGGGGGLFMYLSFFFCLWGVCFYFLGAGGGPPRRPRDSRVRAD